ncbi:MAG: hypothetical protein ABJB61_13065 [bacterium]
MSKPSTDTVTERAVATYRETGVIPARLTLRFLALLKKQELASLSRKLKLAIDNRELPGTGGETRKRRQWARFERVQSERRQRGHIK